MPYYPTQPKQSPGSSPHRRKTVRLIILFVSAAMVLYGGIRLGIYTAELLASRRADAIVAEILADAETSGQMAGELGVESQVTEMSGSSATYIDTAEAVLTPEPAVETAAPSAGKITNTLPIVQYPNGYRGNEKILRLQRESPYIVGLLQMDGMKSPEAVVKRDNTFYLTHDALGNKNSNGAIFMDESISLETRPYTILLYGHNMKTGEKFGMLRKLEDFSYYYQHRIFHLSLTYDDGEYVIFSVANVDLTPGCRNYVSLTGLRSSDRNTRLKALNSLIGCSVHQNTLDVNEEDQLVLLITCVGNDDERLIVAGRRLREGEQADNLIMK